MARVLTCGWESGHHAEGVGNTITGANHSADASVKRTGGYSAKLNTGASAAAQRLPFATGVVLGGRVSFRVWLRFPAAPAALTQIFGFGTGTTPIHGAKLDTSRQLQWYESSTARGSTSAALAVDTWHLLEGTFKVVTGAGNDEIEFKVNGTSLYSTTTATLADSSFQAFLSLAIDAAAGNNWICYFDDLKINNDTGASENSFPGDGDLAFLLPTADSSVGTGWQKPGGATTNLYTSIDNRPPAGVADSTNSAQAENQIRNASSNSASYVATIQTYTAGGVSGTVNGVQALAAVAAPVATGAKSGSVGVASNPAGSAASFGNYHSGTNAGTFPTGWKYAYGPYEASPSVTLGTAPTVTLNITGGTASRIAMASAIGIYVDYSSTSTQTLTPGLFTDSQTFHAPTVAPGGVTLTPSLLSGSQSFHAPTIAQVQALTPGLFTDSQSFFAPTVAAGSVTLAPSLFSGSQSFHAATVAPGAVALAPDLSTNSQSFPTATVGASNALAPSLLSNGQDFFAAALSPGAVALEPPVLSGGQSFFGAVIAPGAVDLTPALHTNTQSFFDPSVAPGIVDLQPSLVSGSADFYAATIGQGSGNQALEPSLADIGATIHAPVVASAYSLAPALVANGQTFYAPAVEPGAVTAVPSLLTNAVSFFSPVASSANSLQAPLLTNAQAYLAPAVAPGAATVLPPLFANAPSFFDHVLAPGPVDVAPTLAVNDNQFPAATATTRNTIAPPLLANDNEFLSPGVDTGAAVLAPSLVAGVSIFLGGRVRWVLPVPAARAAHGTGTARGIGETLPSRAVAGTLRSRTATGDPRASRSLTAVTRRRTST